MEWYIWLIIIAVVIVGIYILLKLWLAKQVADLGIPLISDAMNFIDKTDLVPFDILPSVLGAVKPWYSKPRGRTKYYKKETEVWDLWSQKEEEGFLNLPPEMMNNLNTEIDRKWGKGASGKADFVGAEKPQYESDDYNKKTGVITENVSIDPGDDKGYRDVTVKYNLKTGSVKIKDGFTDTTPTPEEREEFWDKYY